MLEFQILKELRPYFLKVKLYGTFLCPGFRYLKVAEQLGDSLLSFAKSQEDAGTYLIELRKMKGLVNHGAT